MKLTFASKGPLEDMDAWTKCGYLSRSQAASDPGYDPPNAIHLTCRLNLYLSFILLMKYAKSASAWLDERYSKFFVLRFLQEKI